MKKFLINLSIFALVVLLIITTFYAYLYQSRKNELVKIPKKNIIIGDSNTRWSLDDHILNSYSNYSVGGETYLFAYTKLKIFEKNNKIDTLILAFSPHNVINNIWWNDNEKLPVRGRMPAFFQNFTFEDHMMFIMNTPKNYFSAMENVGKSEINDIFTLTRKRKVSRFGFFMPEKHNETQIKPIFYHYKYPSVSTPEKKYLDKIIQECKSKDIQLIFINTPKNFPRKDYKNYNHPEFYQFYKRYYRNIDFLDFSQLPMPEKGYYDINHLSIIGAEYFSFFLHDNGISKLLKSKYNLKNDHR